MFGWITFAAESLLVYVVQIEALAAGLTPTAVGPLSGVIESTREVTQFLEDLLDRHERQREQQRPKGRPKLAITEGQLRELIRSNFSVVGIAQLFSCSTKTIYRRIREFNLIGALQSNISDADLDEIVEAFVQAHPASGQRMLVGHLRSLSLHVSRQRARESLLRVDPQGVSL